MGGQDMRRYKENDMHRKREISKYKDMKQNMERIQDRDNDRNGGRYREWDENRERGRVLNEDMERERLSDKKNTENKDWDQFGKIGWGYNEEGDRGKYRNM